MKPLTPRRTCLIGGGAVFAGPVEAADRASETLQKIRQIEASASGRVGVFAQATSSGASLGYRSNQPFPMCSTFKFLLAGAVLKWVDQGLEQLDRRVGVTAADMLSYARVSKMHLSDGAMTVAELCQAAVTLSDNTAANLVLASIGGPAFVTQFACQIGDPSTRLDRNEPSLDSALPGDLRDTTTSRALGRDMLSLTIGPTLPAKARERLAGWLVACKTGAARIRAGCPGDVRVGDETKTEQSTTWR